MPQANCLALLFGIAIAADAGAQANPILDEVINPMMGTVSVSAERMTNGGALSGCSLEYTLLHRDDTYSQGRPLAIKGSIVVFTNTQAGAVLALKLVLADFNYQTATFTPAKLTANTAFLETAAGASNLRSLLSAHDSDIEGGRLFVFDLYEQQPIFQAIADNNIRIVFNRKPGGADIRVPVDLTVSDTEQKGKRKRSRDSLMGFESCLLEFLADVQKRFKK